MSLENRLALVTGGSSGIGKAICLELARQGAKVAVNYVGDATAAEQVVAEMNGNGDRHAFAVEADVSRSEEVRAMVRQAAERLGGLNLLVNDAGVEKRQPFLEKSEQEWDHVIAVDLKGPFLCSQEAARQMVRLGTGGTIINISSVHESLAFPGYAAYCAAKGGLRMLCRDMALELAPHHINVVNVAPGAIATPINQKTLDDPQQKAKLESEIPAHRIGTAEEVAKLVAYLASDEASYITGETIVIAGGLMRATGSL
jgi:glucose 1-dehydrogenase